MPAVQASAAGRGVVAVDRPGAEADLPDEADHHVAAAAAGGTVEACVA